MAQNESRLLLLMIQQEFEFFGFLPLHVIFLSAPALVLESFFLLILFA